MRASPIFVRAALKRTLDGALLAILVSAGLPAQAADLIGLYVGGAVGQSRVEVDSGAFNVGSFKENHSAYKAIVGIKPIPVFSVEAEYVDFGHPSGALGNFPGDVKIKGAAAFAVWTLPIPVIDVFLKGGLARLQSTVTGYVGPPAGAGTCPVTGCVVSLFKLDRTNTSYAVGAGVQFKAGAWAIRGEYERFDAAGGNPGLASVGITWTFL